MAAYLFPYNITLKQSENTDVKYKYTLKTSERIRKNSSSDFIEKEIEINYKNIITKNHLGVTVTTQVNNFSLDHSKTKQEDFIAQIQTLTNKLMFKVDYLGRIIDLENHSLLLENWKLLKEKLEKTYKGKAVKRYLQQLEKKVTNKKQLITDFEQHRLYGLFWNNQYGDFSKNKSITRVKKHLKIIESMPLEIMEQLEWMGAPYVYEKEDLELKLSGDIKANNYQTKIENYLENKDLGKHALKLENYDGRYILDSKTGIIKSISLKVVISYGKAYQKHMDYKITQIPI